MKTLSPESAATRYATIYRDAIGKQQA